MKCRMSQVCMKEIKPWQFDVSRVYVDYNPFLFISWSLLLIKNKLVAMILFFLQIIYIKNAELTNLFLFLVKLKNNIYNTDMSFVFIHLPLIS